MADHTIEDLLAELGVAGDTVTAGLPPKRQALRAEIRPGPDLLIARHANRSLSWQCSIPTRFVLFGPFFVSVESPQVHTGLFCVRPCSRSFSMSDLVGCARVLRSVYLFLLLSC